MGLTWRKTGGNSVHGLVNIDIDVAQATDLSERVSRFLPLHAFGASLTDVLMGSLLVAGVTESFFFK